MLAADLLFIQSILDGVLDHGLPKTSAYRIA
jgi:hypothetical protein